MIKHLTAVLGLDKTGFDAGMAAAGNQVNQFGAGLKSSLAGAFGASAFIALGKSAIEAADQIEEIADRLGVTTIQAQQFALAAKMGGSDAEFFAVKLEKLRKSLREGISKGENPLDVFGAEATTDAAKAMEIFANAFSSGGMTGEQEARYFDLIEKGAGKLKTILGGLKDARGGALFFSDDDIARGKEMSDWIDKAGVSLKTLFMMSIDPKNGAFAQIMGAMGVNAFGVLDDPKSQPKTGIDESDFLANKDKERIAQLEREEWAQRMFRIESQTENIAENNRISGLSTEERLVELASEREKIFQRISATEEERAQKQLDLAKNESDIIGLSKVPDAKESSFKINESAMGRIGAFTGAAASAALPPGQAQQIQQLQKIYDAMVIKGIVVRDSR